MGKTLGWCALGLSLLTGGARAADICEPLRQRIEAQIASNGVTGFVVTVVDAQAQAEGKVLGNCANGTRKIVYQRGRAGGAATAGKPGAARRTGAPAPDDEWVTECRDGSILRGNALCKP